MALVTTRLKQRILGYLLVLLLAGGVFGLVWRFFALLPWLAWPLLAAGVGAFAWWIVRDRRANAPHPWRAMDPGEVPVVAGDTVESLAFRILEANVKAGRRIGPAELGIARELAARGLRRFGAS